MMRRTIINNIIVLVVYALSIVVSDCYPTAFDRALAPHTNTLILGCFVVCLYILCGFFLMPVVKQSFLSVVSVAIILVILLFILVMSGSALGYFALNPIVGVLKNFAFFTSAQFVVVMLSPVYPSLLFYLGMLLRRLVMIIMKKGA